MALRIYLAGPDVFRPSIGELAAAQHRLCAELGVVALHPADHPGLDAATIYRNNIALLRQADGVAANLDPFRGAEIDSGTAFEVGYAVALGKPVVGYVSQPGALVDRVRDHWGPLVRDEARRTWHDRDGDLVENFGYPVNLMIGVPCAVVTGGLRQAIETLKRAF